MTRYFMGRSRIGSKDYATAHGVSHGFRASPRALFSAARHAQQAADFLLAFQHRNATAESERRAA